MGGSVGSSTALERKCSLLRSARTLTDLSNALVSFKRVEAFLNEPDSMKWTHTIEDKLKPSTELGMSDLVARWHGDAGGDGFVLGPMTLSFPKGKISLIVGPVGSGKSLTLAALLGEANIVNGHVSCPTQIMAPVDVDPNKCLGSESTSFCSQSAWVVSASIRDKYVRVCIACRSYLMRVPKHPLRLEVVSTSEASDPAQLTSSQQR